MKKTILLLLAITLTACASTAGRMPQVTLNSMDAASRARADAYYHFLLGNLLEQDGQMDQALAEYRAADRDDPGSPDIAMALASLTLRKGNPDEAILHARRAVELEPGRTSALLMLANIYTNKKKYDEAADLYRKVIAQEPKKEDTYIYLGSLFASMKRFDDAIETFRQLEKVNPNSLMSPYYQARILTERQKFKEATAEFKRAISIRDDFEPAYTGLAFVYELMDRPVDAIEAYRKAAAINPHNSEVTARLAQLYIQQNSLDKALQQFKQLVANDPDNCRCPCEDGPDLRREEAI